jgi:hypothetical protein
MNNDALRAQGEHCRADAAGKESVSRALGGGKIGHGYAGYRFRLTLVGGRKITELPDGIGKYGGWCGVEDGDKAVLPSEL